MGDGSARVARKEVRGVMRDIFVDSNGIFYSSVNGDAVKAPTMEILLKKLITATAPERQNLSIRFCRLDNRESNPVMLHGTITGKHATNGNMLIRFDGQKGSVQESVYSFSRTRDENFLRMTEEQEKEFLDLVREELAAKKKVEKLIQKYGFDAVPEVQAALKKLGVPEEE